MEMHKEIYGLGEVEMHVYEDGANYIKNGMFGIWFEGQEMKDLWVLMDAYAKEQGWAYVG